MVVCCWSDLVHIICIEYFNGQKMEEEFQISLVTPADTISKPNLHVTFVHQMHIGGVMHNSTKFQNGFIILYSPLCFSFHGELLSSILYHVCHAMMSLAWNASTSPVPMPSLSLGTCLRVPPIVPHVCHVNRFTSLCTCYPCTVKCMPLTKILFHHFSSPEIPNNFLVSFNVFHSL